MMRRRRLLWAASMVVAALVVVGLVLALGACSAGDKEQAKDRHLPEEAFKALPPGEYHSEEFKPAFSFRVGKGWQTPDAVINETLERLILESTEEVKGSTLLIFRNPPEAYDPQKHKRVNVNSYEDILSWFEDHPYLKTSKPQPVTVGGVKGEQLEVLVDHLPKDPNGYCDPEPSGCLDIFNQSSNDIGYFGKNHNKRRVIVLGDVKGDTVVIWYAGPPDTFEKFAPRAQKVVDTVKWGGS